MTDFNFAWPAVLLLLPLPWLARRYLKPEGGDEAGRLRLPIQASWIPNETKQAKPSSRLDLIWLWVAWLLLITALCRPQILGPPISISQAGRDLMMAVDISKSMEERDFIIEGQTVDRLTAVKAIASRFIEERKEDRIGLILFGSLPYLQAPLTFDHTSLTVLLREAFNGMAGNGTAIGDSIGMAVKTLKEQPAQSRVLILLTDGENTSGQLSPEDAVTLAQEIDLKIYTIGIGQDPSQRNLRNFGGMFGAGPLEQLFNRQLGGNNPIDEETLKSIAEATGGQYFRATETEELRDIYEIIDKLERREDENEFIRPAKDYYHWPLLGMMLMLLIYLSERHTSIQWSIFWRPKK